jgi:hypothetical protein
MKKYLILIIFLFCGIAGFAQQINRFNPDTIKTIHLDSTINIKSHKLNAQDFIDAMLADTGFYKAFHDLKDYDFIAENRIYTYDKKNKIDGRIYRKLHHTNQHGKHIIQTVAKSDTGKVYKHNGKYQLYTVEMFDYIFQNPNSSDFVKGEDLPGGKNESYKDKLKTLIFTPGRRVKGVPFISSKTEVFSDDMKQYYNYEFARGTYLDSIPVYRFKVVMKPNLSSGDKDGVMIKEMTTIFDTRTFKVLGRYIDMKYSNFLFDFNVQMNLELANYGGQFLPSKISYQGNWNIPFHKEERASFLVVHKDYRRL